MTQDGATVAQIDAQMKQILFFGADLFYPERHHLHIAARAFPGYGIFFETALYFDQAQYQLRIKAGTGCFVMHSLEKIHAVGRIRQFFLQTARHFIQPEIRFILRGEGKFGRGLIGDTALHHRAHTGGKRCVNLSARLCGASEQHPRHAQGEAA